MYGNASLVVIIFVSYAWTVIYYEVTRDMKQSELAAVNDIL